MTAVKVLMRRLDALGGISDEPRRLTRTFCSPAMRQANDLVGDWMRDAGMTVREDAIGNIIGFYPGTNRNPKTFLLGSHLDTVRNAGKFDGALGVLLAITCIDLLNKKGKRLPFSLEVIGFADEEGVRYQSAYLGSRVVAGTFDSRDLNRKDADGISMTQAIRDFGGNPTRLKQASMKGRAPLGYLEAHIEQGPVLDQMNLSVAVVTAITGQSRLRLVFTGKAGHAGTTPMNLRHDAFCGAAEFALAVERFARRTSGLVATVGQILAEPNVSNVIPGAVTVSLDVRHQKDIVRRGAAHELTRLAHTIARGRNLKLSAELIQETAAKPCCPTLSGVLERAVKRFQRKKLRLPSGAGHDAAVMSALTSVAMLFVRCRNGLSHHPAEAVAERDVQKALKTMSEFLRLLAKQYE
jgi:allantoate deiminase